MPSPRDVECYRAVKWLAVRWWSCVDTRRDNAVEGDSDDECRGLRDSGSPGVNKPTGPHTLRHAFITAALDAGVPLRDVQKAASHADPRTTMRYDRARVSLDRHATYIVAAYLAGAAR